MVRFFVFTDLKIQLSVADFIRVANLIPIVAFFIRNLQLPIKVQKLVAISLNRWA